MDSNNRDKKLGQLRERKSTTVDLADSIDGSGRYMDMPKKVTLSKNLKHLMEREKVSATKLGKVCSIPKSTISSYLSGKKASYSPEHLAALSDYFSVSTDYLLFGESADVEALNSLPVEGVFEGWLKVKIERAVPIKNKKGD